METVSKTKSRFALFSFLLFSLLFLAMSVMAVRSFSSSNRHDPPERQRALYIDPDTVDFHEVEEGVHEKTVDLVNASDQKIVLLFAWSTCSCSLAKIPAESISPRERLPLLCTLTTMGRNGAVGGTVVIAYRFESDSEDVPVMYTAAKLRARAPSSAPEESKQEN